MIERTKFINDISEFDKIKFTVKKATTFDLLSNLLACDEDFLPPLSMRVNLEEYANKLNKSSITFEAWNGSNRLIGMIAAYFDDVEESLGFITNVCVEKEYKGNKIASELMSMCIDYALEKRIKKIILEVNEKNTAAIKLYRKFNFNVIEAGNENIKMVLETYL